MTYMPLVKIFPSSNALWVEIQQIFKYHSVQPSRLTQAQIRPSLPGTSRGFSATVSQPKTPNVTGVKTESASVSAVESASAAPKLTHIQRFKELWHKYGFVFIGTYFTIWGATFGSMYLLVDNHLMKINQFDENGTPNPFNPIEMQKRFMNWVKETFGFDMGLENVDNTSSLFVAYIATKALEPARFVLAALFTPRVARLVGRAPK
eukprot:CAMPEP_0196572336 /NCGR_PEP_ID=MMETSP1081-20130531/2405_1 /TAXON_ID=36882 /ORGANISM="Pyramimonas amylifera, Strain CCMP720" /LENGTH=205 /DNA_ID=CAMNT_0041889621 /DNA_START=158 /DNA_END=775 /DNA_ORIENTATION=+